jgi:hypothetical protein
MNQAYKLLIPALLLITMLIGSASAKCPDIPSPPYIPESPQEDIVRVEVYLDPPPSPAVGSASATTAVTGYLLHVTVVFAAATPPSGQAINILVTQWKGDPLSEIQVTCFVGTGPTKTTYELAPDMIEALGLPEISVYAWLGQAQTDRAPNDGFYQITSLSASDPNVFQDYEPAPVGGVMVQKNSLEILTPYITLAGLVAAISTVYVIKKRK